MQNMSSSQSSIPLIFLCILLYVSLLLEPCFSATERCHPEEKKVLLKIKKTFKNATIPYRPWFPNTDCCYWYGVTCDDTNHHVIGLTFTDTDYPDTIPDAIGDLLYLTALYFYNVSTLSGSIPFSITKLQHLTILEITKTNLAGPIPGFLSKLKKLYYLDLSSNKLKGSIPSSLSESSSLSFIDLGNNQLTGTIPESFVKLKANDLKLILSHNKLSGEIPPSFRDINFSSIDFSHNKLRGDISMLFGRNKTTDSMNFAWNKFEFNMSKLQLNPMLIVLDVNHNKIYGSLPKDIIGVWQSLNVSYNRLCGPIPQGRKLQTEFDYSCFFHNRCLCGAPLNVACK